ncbi:tRNA:m(4)X modification enzyme TRM13 homolog [Uranotaenia lowii]|uniref:tRNA:m(4)X modification enzyme TRM13 homolog n=1 Tax=Uranotaenia lowii TaxID=190385 RepID=UPI00247ACED6|nr:tRNA:m(4)X modification enzyme TRM13 homolog [Uranotaenia lowii]
MISCFFFLKSPPNRGNLAKMSTTPSEEPEDKPQDKRPKLSMDEKKETTATAPLRCKYFVQRKKRFCKMTVGRGREYCGEHEPHIKSVAEVEVDALLPTDRIPCPLDPKHSVSRSKLEKHLKICNAKPGKLPDYIQVGVNADSEGEFEVVGEIGECKLSEVSLEELDGLIKRITKIYEDTKVGTIEELILEHAAFRDELANESYGPQTLKHLKQSASLLGIVEHEHFLSNDTAFVEFGAGKGQVAFWLATIIQQLQKATEGKINNAKVLLIDRASHRHKKDNKIDDRDLVQRVRADIADLVLGKLELLNGTQNVVGVGKHLCGGATDLALRCLIRANRKNSTEIEGLMSKGFVFALCCHHRCDWKTYTGKQFLQEREIKANDFQLIVKMVSWAVCGTGTSRERRKSDGSESDTLKYGLTRAEREMIGYKCKRVLDWGRIRYLESNGFTANLKYYAKKDITLENVCLIGHIKKV